MGIFIIRYLALKSKWRVNMTKKMDSEIEKMHKNSKRIKRNGK